ncbi:hypothetical protein [Chondrinema litorale]|uniref:hypothetical protein n=1 Tax=Chondrinema litorale TaxID=2994555 RepID=UPI00254353D2|nr:hypothetical protein [Chondrinema litorale]UZR99311.1 hypothetical protein OQ292_36200 [Chondrinema litorale]
MKILTLIILTIISVNVYGQAKFDSQIGHNLEFVHVHKTKQLKTKRYRKQNLGSGNKLKFSLGYGLSVYNTKLQETADLRINESTVYFGDKKVGTSQSVLVDDQYENNIQLGNKSVKWYSDDLPTNYELVNESNASKKTVGLDLEFRVYKYDGLGSPTGFFFKTGIYYLDKSLPTLNYQENELLFPVGLGLIIPGGNRFRVEVGGNGMLGNKGCLGGKFDFSFVFDDVKFGPSFIYLTSEQDISLKAGGLGFGLSYVPVKIKRYNKRRRRF